MQPMQLIKGFDSDDRELLASNAQGDELENQREIAKVSVPEMIVSICRRKRKKNTTSIAHRYETIIINEITQRGNIKG